MSIRIPRWLTRFAGPGVVVPTMGDVGGGAWDLGAPDDLSFTSALGDIHANETGSPVLVVYQVRADVDGGATAIVGLRLIDSNSNQQFVVGVNDANPAGAAVVSRIHTGNFVVPAGMSFQVLGMDAATGEPSSAVVTATLNGLWIFSGTG